MDNKPNIQIRRAKGKHPFIVKIVGDNGEITHTSETLKTMSAVYTNIRSAAVSFNVARGTILFVRDYVKPPKGEEFRTLQVVV
jgi:hypothetical protein